MKSSAIRSRCRAEAGNIGGDAALLIYRGKKGDFPMSDDIKKQFWKALADSPYVMVGQTGEREHRLTSNACFPGTI